MRKWMTGAVLLILLGGLVSCGSPEKPDDGQLSVAVTIAPQEFFVERIGGEEVRVTTLVPPGQSLHTYEPKPQQVGQLQQADLYFRIGVPFENRLIERVAGAIGYERIIDTRRGIILRPIEGHDHTEGMDEEVHGEALDPHIWLDPMLVKTQAATIAQALIGIRPERQEYFAGRLREFERELDSLDRLIGEQLAPYAGRAVYVFHPSYGYFTDRYGLRQVAIESEGKEPSARQLAELIERAQANRVTTVFAQRQFAQKTAHAVAEAIGAEIAVLDPMAEDYLDNLTATARAIAASFEGFGE